MLSVVFEFVGLVVEDHNAVGDEGPKFMRILSQEFVGFGCFGITIALGRDWHQLLDNIVWVRSCYDRTNRLPLSVSEARA